MKSLPTGSALDEVLTGWMIWLRLRRSAVWAVQGFLFGLGLALGLAFSLLGKYALDLRAYILLTASCGLGGLVLAFLIALRLPLTRLETARYFDRHFGLFDRTATAVELEEQAGGLASEEIRRLQGQDAAASARQVRPTWRFVLQASRLQVILAVILLAASSVTAAVSAPLFEKAQEKAAFQQAVQAEIERLRAEQEQINQNEALTPEKRLELSQKIENAIAALEKAQTVDQAVAALEKLQNDLNANNTAQIQSEANDLQQAGQQILNNAENQATPLGQTAQALAGGNTAQAAQSLGSLDLSQLSPAERADLINQLRQMAESVKESNPDLASALQDAARALERGDLQAAAEALDQASQMLAASAQNIAQAQAASQAAGTAASASQQIVQSGIGQQSGQSGTSGSGQGQGQAGQGQSGQSGTPGSGQGQGQAGQGQSGQSGQSGTSGTGSGSGSGSGSGTGAAGSEVGSDPISQNNGPGDGGESTFTPGDTSSHIGGSAGSEVTLPPSNNQGGELVGVEGSNPGASGPASVPYQQTSANPVETYRRYLNAGKIPPGLQSVIQSYFSNFGK